MTPTPTVISDADRVPDDVAAHLYTLLGRLIAKPGVHHANLAIAAVDGRRWSGAAGAAGPDGTPLRPETPFFIASVTKRFIITLVLQGHERRELDLDAPVVTYLPAGLVEGMHVRRGRDHTPHITVRHLASHTSGLPDYFDKPRHGPSVHRELSAGHDRAWTFEDMVRQIRHDHRPHFPPQDLTASRQKARYSDTGFQMLIRIVETATGRTFAQLLAERICEPAGLEHTWLPAHSSPAAPVAPPSTLYTGSRPLDVPEMIRSSNDLMSTTTDLLAFQQALLAGELFENPATVVLLTERSNLLRNAYPLRYGLGTMTFHINRASAPGRRPLRLVGHSGATGSWLFHCPELDIHLAGTVDQTRGRALPFRLMIRMLRAW